MAQEKVMLPEGWTLEEHESGQGPNRLRQGGRTVAAITFEVNYPVPRSPSPMGGGHFNADRWFWDPVPEDYGHAGRPGGYAEYGDALKAALAYAQKREA